MTVRYVDLINGSDAADGLSFANRKKTITSASSGASAGDVIRVMKSDDPTSIGSATWTNKSGVTLSGARTVDLYTDGAWTGTTNITSTTTTTRKEGTNAASITPAAAFATGLMAYYDTGGTQDLSSYQKISLWFHTSAAVADMSIYQIKLCSDAAGATPVETFTLAGACAANTWIPFTFDKGSALSSTVRSVALYATSDPGTVGIIIDNVFATNDIALDGLISKNGNGDGDTKFWAIRSVVGTAVILDSYMTSGVAQATRGYYGTTESVTTYFQNPIRLALTAVAATTDIFTIGTSGSAGSPITISGGWDQTDMSTQTGVTWISHPNGTGEMFGISAKNYNSFEYIYIHGCDTGWDIAGASNGHTWSNCGTSGLQDRGINSSATALNGLDFVGTDCYFIQSQYGMTIATSAPRGSWTRCYCYSHSADGMNVVNTNATNFDTCSFSNNAQQGIESANCDGLNYKDCSTNDNSTTAGLQLTECSKCIYTNFTSTGNTGGGIRFDSSPMNVFYNLTTSGNSTAGIISVTPSSAENYLFNPSISEATEISGLVDFENTYFISINHDTTANNHYIFTDGGSIHYDGTKWILSPTSTNRNSMYPLFMRLQSVAVAASSLVTVTMNVTRSNTGLTGVLRLRGGQIGGVSSDVTATTVGSAGSPEDLVITFTPNEKGVIELLAEAYGGTTYTLNINSITISQA